MIRRSSYRRTAAVWSAIAAVPLLGFVTSPTASAAVQQKAAPAAASAAVATGHDASAPNGIRRYFGYQIAYESNTSSLWSTCDDGTGNQNQGMWTTTNPAIADTSIEAAAPTPA